MAIHAQLSPEALENLRRQKRNSSISSVLVSVLVVALIFLIMGVLFFEIQPEKKSQIVTYLPPKVEENKIPEKKLTHSVMRKPSAPSVSPAKVIAAPNLNALVSIPVPDVDVTTPSLAFGDGESFGNGYGNADDFGPGDDFKKIPLEIRTRCDPGNRMRRLKEAGGTEKGEEAVIAALDFLQKTQNADGSWDTVHPVAMTGFALLAYLGHCETPQSKKYGDTVLKAITYLVDNGLKQDGRLTNKPDNSIAWVYDHGIATYALAESFTFCNSLKIKIPDLEKATKKAGEIIMKGQAPSGGWHYRYGQAPGGDNSVGFWQIQALKACKHTGLWKDSELTKHSRLALDFLKSVQGPDGAIGYREDSKRSPGLTGGGVLALQIWGEGDKKAAQNGIDWIDENSKFNWGSADSNLYYHYYKIQAMLNHGGKEWDKYNKMIRDPLIGAQNKDGSWTQANFGNHGPVNLHMATCLATLSLEVYYRFLPSSDKEGS